MSKAEDRSAAERYRVNADAACPLAAVVGVPLGSVRL